MQQTDYSKGQVRRFLGYLRDYKIEFFVAIIGMIGYSALDTYVVAHLKTLIDESLANNDSSFLRMAAYAIVPLFLLRGVFNFMGTYTLNWIGAKVVMTMRQQLFEKYLHLRIVWN